MWKMLCETTGMDVLPIVSLTSPPRKKKTSLLVSLPVTSSLEKKILVVTSGDGGVTGTWPVAWEPKQL